MLAMLATLSCSAQAERLYLQVAGAGDVPLNVVTVGNPANPAIVFLHGIGQSHASFLRQLDSELSEDYYLVSFDLRGHGNSAKPWQAADYAGSEIWAEDLQAVLKATVFKETSVKGVLPQRPVVVAWSYGTLVLADYIRTFGAADFSGINLVGSFGALVAMTPPSDKALIARFIALKKLQTSSNVQDNTKAVDQSVEWLTASPVDSDSQRLFARAGMMLPGYARVAMSQRRFDNSDLVEKFDVPVLISRGDQDPSAPKTGADALVKLLPDATITTYKGTGHSPFYEQAARFNRELRQFVEQTRRATQKD